MIPYSARLNQTDPFGGFDSVPISKHAYIYANNQPSMCTNPSGKVTLTEAMVTSSVIGGLSGAAIGGIQDGWRGAVYGAIAGATISPVVTGAVMVGGPYVGMALGVSPGTGMFITGMGATAIFSAAEIKNVATATSRREVVASSVALAITVSTSILGARAYFGVRSGRGTFVNMDPQTSTEEVAVGRWLASTLQADVIRQAPVGARGPGTADYRIAFMGKTLELKNMTNSESFNSVTRKIGEGQSLNMVVVLQKGQFSADEMARIPGRVFGNTSKESIQIIYQEGNGYVSGEFWSRGSR